MRTILKFTVPVEAGNQAIRSGRIGPVVEALMQSLKPEAAYFYTEDGRRHGLMVFEMQDPSDIPSVAEPLFMELNAAVELHPCMNTADLQKGLAKFAAAV